MEVSMILAKIFGWYLFIVSLAMIAKPSGFQAMSKAIHGHAGSMAVAGFIALILGLIVVIIHPVWGSSWQIVISVLGWLMLIKGLVRLFFPAVSAAMVKSADNKSFYFTLAVIGLLVGLFLLYHGYAMHFMKAFG